MDKVKTNKKDKVGADGLTKKERRALKVQSRECDSQDTSANKNSLSSPENKAKTAHPKPTKPNSKTAEVNIKPNKQEEAQKKVENEIESKKAPIATQLQLSDKELRKLEWQKKLAEQKDKDGKGKKEEMSKAELKAKRREQQEAQRQLKAAASALKTPKTDVITTPKTVAPPSKQEQTSKPISDVRALPRKSPAKRVIKRNIQAHKVDLVEHLYVEKTSNNIFAKQIIHNDIHPVFLRLGVQYTNKTIIGSNARCLALLAALKHLVDDLQTPPKQEYCRYLDTVLQKCTIYLQTCRPFAVSMTNALKYFKLQLTHVETNLEDNRKREKLTDIIDTYISDDIKKAGEAISLKVTQKITDGDVILTYGCSSLIKRILLEANKEGKKFTVIITDGRPLLEGKEMLRRLVIAGIECKYILINAVSYCMSSVTKVLLGAHALLTNGYVMSRIGTAQVALVAHAYNKPVLVCCETYKFSERVQTDSFVYNEIDDPQKNKSHVSKFTSPLSNLLYDVTPSDFVTAVVTEKAIIPCTSVPVVLRINANEG